MFEVSGKVQEVDDYSTTLQAVRSSLCLECDKTLEEDCYPADINIAMARLQFNLDAVMTWASNCGLVPNPDKCKYMIFGCPQRMGFVLPPVIGLTVNSVILEQVQQFKYLGVWLDSQLN